MLSLDFTQMFTTSLFKFVFAWKIVFWLYNHNHVFMKGDGKVEVKGKKLAKFSIWVTLMMLSNTPMLSNVKTPIVCIENLFQEAKRRVCRLLRSFFSSFALFHIFCLFDLLYYHLLLFTAMSSKELFEPGKKLTISSMAIFQRTNFL